MELPVYNQQGKKIGSQEVPEGLFGLEPNDTLIHQVYTVKWNNRRKPYAHTKTRADVRGGGRKPWRQKGTGRARHGSTRSPIWIGGGVTFGPRSDRVFGGKINKKMNRKAMFIVLSSKFKNGNIFVVETLKFEDPKTKLGALLLKELKINTKSNIVYGTKEDENFKRVFKNIPKTVPNNLESLNVVDLLQKQNVIFSKTAIENFIKMYKDRVSIKTKPKSSREKVVAKV